MTMQLALSKPEVDLILELLESEQKELLIEIRHTDNKIFRAGLKERLAVVESLVLRAQELTRAEAVGSREAQ